MYFTFMINKKISLFLLCKVTICIFREIIFIDNLEILFNFSLSLFLGYISSEFWWLQKSMNTSKFEYNDLDLSILWYMQDVDYEATMSTKLSIAKKIFSLEKDAIFKSSSFQVFFSDNEVNQSLVLFGMLSIIQFHSFHLAFSIFFKFFILIFCLCRGHRAPD